MNFIFIILTFLISAVIARILIPRILLISLRKKLFDIPDDRKIHKRAIPRLGGVSFFPTTLFAFCLVYAFRLLDGDSISTLYASYLLPELLLFACGMTLLYLTGIADDLVGVRYRQKFAIQIFCACLFPLSGLWINDLYGLFGIHELSAYVGMPFTVLTVVFITNAINLIDGIDGLASGLSIIAFFAFGCMFIRLQWWMYAFICLATIGVLLPFFYYNVYGNVHRGRKIFMGDTGSLTIGMLLAVMAIRLSMSDPLKESTFPGAVVIAFSFLIVPMLDVVRVVLHRWRERKPLFLPDRNHIHHKFIALGLSQRQAMACIIGIALSFAVVNVFLIHCLSTTILFLLDVAVWTVLHCYITVRINRKNKLEKNCTENKI